MSPLALRDARFPEDSETVKALWLEYLTWGNAEMQARHGVHPHSPRETVEQDLASVAKFQAPSGRLLLAVQEGKPCGIGCLRHIGEGVGEIKRMYVDPSFRRAGAGRMLLEGLLAAAAEAGFQTVRLDSPDFMTAAHALYRRCGFLEIAPYPESEIPAEFQPFMVYMERTLP